MIRYSSFNYVALLHSLLANVSVHRSREWGTIAAVVRRQPPWFVVFYRSMHVFCVDLYDKHFYVAKLGNSQYLWLAASWLWYHLLLSSFVGIDVVGTPDLGQGGGHAGGMASQ